MPLPLILVGAAALAGGWGAKKGVDGYKSHSKANEMVDRAKWRYGDNKDRFDTQSRTTELSLEQLGELELTIGEKFGEFSTLADQLLKQLNQRRQDKFNINIPKHRLQKVENYKFTALGVLGSVVGAGASGAAAGFAVYGGVMTFAAASTGTAISALSGVAATNATLAAIGGGALSAGGMGIAGGTAILGAAVAAPVLAIAGWAYASHGEEALRNAYKASEEVDVAIQKLSTASKMLEKTECYALKIRDSLTDIFAVFNKYFDTLTSINKLIEGTKQLGLDPDEQLSRMSDKVMITVENGYTLAAILTDIITTPLFKLKVVGGETIKDDNGLPVMEKDRDGSFILDTAAVDEAIRKGREEVKPYQAA